MTPSIQHTTINLVKSFEDVRHTAYADTAQKMTTGAGHLIKPGEEALLTKVLTDQEVDALLIKDLQVAENAVLRYVKVPMSQNQFDALVSFTFNEGAGSLLGSSLLKKMNAGIVVDESNFTDWDKEHEAGVLVEVKGLKIRRQKEFKIFTT